MRNNELLMRRLTRFIAGCAVASVLCFAFALLDNATGVLQGITLLAGQWVAMAITFGLIGWGAWWASGIIVRSIAEGRLPWAPRPTAFGSEVEFVTVNTLPRRPAASAAATSGVRSERVRRIERMVQL